MKTRQPEIAVISDLHLATRASKAKKVLKYLKSINPGMLVLNGDIIDSWRFSRKYFPKSHLKVIRQFIRMLEKGVHVIYITGNHDEFLRKFNQTQMGNLKIVNQLILEIDGKKTWIFHGDIFDHIIHRAKWLAKFGAAIYGLLSVVNHGLNQLLSPFGLKEFILYKSIKDKLVKDRFQVSPFERVVSKTASAQGYKTVICGHTHQPRDKQIINEHGAVHYLNCGDWVEHFTAAEYQNGKWNLFQYKDDHDDEIMTDEPDIPNEKQLYQSLFRELAMANIL
ncbi:UDP-2,3-diacylglucosamine diphosphatase [Gaoshiqia sp. Z1-71]|uniref:UDP-2,3-diacylglucosamine diphosphatase n=1 Tax=Gaoshiqia hydrogeniformans TaxID=3290090 RepID=UPI003BF8A2A1